MTTFKNSFKFGAYAPDANPSFSIKYINDVQKNPKKK
jgi:hypothetical protein